MGHLRSGVLGAGRKTWLAPTLGPDGHVSDRPRHDWGGMARGPTEMTSIGILDGPCGPYPRWTTTARRFVAAT
jgi:hypothetical protein